ncbi:MAG: hypothetical protein ACTHLE_23080 [Agriterribacter sp.]
MITTEALKIFAKYGGNDDAFTYARKKERAIVSDDEFNKISRFISDLKLVGNGVASPGYEAKVF